MQKILKAKMLGGFSLYYGDEEIVLDGNAMSKTMQLLQFILLHSREGIAKSTVLDVLYGKNEVENKNGSLNNTLFRLRKWLRTAGIPGENYITVSGGVCKWDESIPVQVDCCQFQEIIQNGQRETETEKKMRAFEKGCRMYCGEFLPDMLGEDWAAVQNNRYRGLYFMALEELCIWLKAQKRFEEIRVLTSAASGIYPFDEWEIWTIDSLTAMSRYEEAMEIYERTTKLFFDELGLSPSAEMLRRFEFMAKRIQQSAGAIDDIRARLQEKEQTGGAYFTSFPSFTDLYRVVSRMMERSGISVYIMLCTLKKREEQLRGETEKDTAVSRTLEEAIKKSLRKGDFFTKYNRDQYLVMLSGINHENCDKVSARIDGNFRRMVKHNRYRVEYFTTSVTETVPSSGGGKRFHESESIWKK